MAGGYVFLDDEPVAPTPPQRGGYVLLEDDEPTKSRGLLQRAGDLVAGAVRGAGSIGATLLAPVDIASDAIAGKGLSLESNRERRAAMDAAGLPPAPLPMMIMS